LYTRPPKLGISGRIGRTASVASAKTVKRESPSPRLLTKDPANPGIRDAAISSWRTRSEALRIVLLLPEAGRALDVGEEEGDDTGRQDHTCIGIIRRFRANGIVSSSSHLRLDLPADGKAQGDLVRVLPGVEKKTRPRIKSYRRPCQEVRAGLIVSYIFPDRIQMQFEACRGGLLLRSSSDCRSPACG
jgi:hypothetical protein